MAVKKAYSIADIEKRSFKMLELPEEWQTHLGNVEQSGSIFIYGDSGEGKTTYALQQSKAFCKNYKVHYNSAEEGIRASFKRSLRLNNMKSVESKFTFSKETYDQLWERLSMKRQPKIVVVDSVQYLFRNKKLKDYFNLIETFTDTLFIWLSHITRGKPKGAIAEEIYWDCQNRIWVQDFKAYVQKSRCGADEANPYIIVKSKADERELKLLKNG